MSDKHLLAIREICGITEDAPYGWDVYGDDIKSIVDHAEAMAAKCEVLIKYVRWLEQASIEDGAVIHYEKGGSEAFDPEELLRWMRGQIDGVSDIMEEVKP